MEKRSDKQQAADAPRNLAEMRRWNEQKDKALPDYYLDQVNKRWRRLGRLARGPASLRNAENHT